MSRGRTMRSQRAPRIDPSVHDPGVSTPRVTDGDRLVTAARLWVVAELDRDDARRIALPGGWAPRRLHVTLGFGGRVAPGSARGVADALRPLVAATAPPQATVTDWLVVGDPGREVLARRVESPALEALAAIVRGRLPASEEDLGPGALHLALRDLGPDGPPAAALPAETVVIPSVSVVQDGERHRLPLGATA